MGQVSDETLLTIKIFSTLQTVRLSKDLRHTIDESTCSPWETEETWRDAAVSMAEVIVTLDFTADVVVNDAEDASADRGDELDGKMDISAVHDDLSGDRHGPREMH